MKPGSKNWAMRLLRADEGGAIHDREAAGVTIAELAHLFCCSQRQIDLLAQTGVVVRIRHGRFDVARSVSNYLRHLRERAADRGYLPEGEASNNRDYPAADVGQLRTKLERI